MKKILLFILIQAIAFVALGQGCDPTYTDEGEFTGIMEHYYGHDVARTEVMAGTTSDVYLFVIISENGQKYLYGLREFYFNTAIGYQSSYDFWMKNANKNHCEIVLNTDQGIFKYSSEDVFKRVKLNSVKDRVEIEIGIRCPITDNQFRQLQNCLLQKLRFDYAGHYFDKKVNKTKAGIFLKNIRCL